MRPILTLFLAIGCAGAESPSTSATDTAVVDTGVPAPEASPRCTERTSARCKPTHVADPARGLAMTVVGDDVYWLAREEPFYALHRTSLETGESVAIGRPAPPAMNSLLAPWRMVTDGTTLFILDATCCAGEANILFALDPTTRAWRSRNIGITLGPEAITVGRSIIHVNFGGYFLSWSSTADLSPIRDPSNAYSGLQMLGSDGERVFAQMRVKPAGTKIVELDEAGGIRDLARVSKDVWGGYMELPVDDSYVYFAYDTILARASKDTPGAATTIIDDAPNHPLYARVDGASVYFVDEQRVYENKVALGDVVEPNGLAQNANWLVFQDKNGISKIHK